MNFHFDELGYDPDEAREGREIERRKKMATTRRAPKKSVVLVPVRQTKNTVVFGPEDGDIDAPIQALYVDKRWAEGVPSLTVTGGN